MTLPTKAQLDAVTARAADGTYEPALRTVLNALVTEISARNVLVQNQATTTQLSSATDPINTTGKVVGKPVYNTTTSKAYYAIGTTATSKWRPYADDSGTGDITPA